MHICTSSTIAFYGWVFATDEVSFQWNNLAWSDAISAETGWWVGAIEHSLEGHNAIDHSRTHTHTHTHSEKQELTQILLRISE